MTGQQMLQHIGPNLLFYIQVFSSLHIDLFFREREQQQRNERELRELAHRAEIESLKAQIQPHFLFNTLNSISASVSAENERTRVLIAQLADTFRYALQSTQAELVLLTQELEFIRTYLSLEQSRFGRRLHFEIDVYGCGQALIPPMLLQPLVENAVKHGIEPAIDGGTIHITCRSTGSFTHLTIRNTGKPYEGTVENMFAGDGIGLNNTAKRLRNQFGENLHIEVDHSGAVTLRFAIPT
ncbi:sensor histidine kinase [Sphingobacterium suaedae]|uniref:Sensor histidine kinase n=2 Tax=Sphingobacterium suaedae TaxID=1686402 RepID=A0ABW5KMG4_9SPHI